MSQLFACKGREFVLQQIDTDVTNVLQNRVCGTVCGEKCVSLRVGKWEVSGAGSRRS